MNSKKILVTGGAGFIGSHLAEKLIGQNNEVFVIDNFETGAAKNLEHLKDSSNLHLIQGSVLDEELMAQTVAKADEIYHLAATVGVKKVIQKPLTCLLTNIKGTEIVLREAEKSKKKVLIASSSEVYGKSRQIPFREDGDRTYGSVDNHRWSYAFSKGVDEFMALSYFREKNLPVVIVRFFNVIGPRQIGKYGMVVPTFVKQALKNEPITVYGDGSQTRSFCDVLDIVEALMVLMRTKEAEGQVLNVGADKEISMNDLARKVKELASSSSEIIHVPYEQAYSKGFEELQRRVPDISKLRNMIGYEPKISLEQTIERIIRYHKENSLA